MIREDSDTYGLIHRHYLIIYRGNESLVEILDGLQFQFEVTIVACLVARLYMDEHEVILLEGLNSSLSLTFVVGVSQTSSTLDLHNLQTSIVADATNKVYGRDDGTRLHLRILLHERFHRRTIATTPRPNAVSLALTTLGTFLIERMLSEELL